MAKVPREFNGVKDSLGSRTYGLLKLEKTPPKIKSNLNIDKRIE